MSLVPNGELIPVGGGDAIPLLRSVLTIGRRDSCDIPMRFPNVSGQHCELRFQEGVWVIEDSGSTNGIKVNGNRTLKKALRPGDTITIAKRTFTIEYTAAENSKLFEETAEEVTQMSLLEKAGLAKPQRKRPGSTRDDDE